jgi:SAM-dependent methyltransferase
MSRAHLWDTVKVDAGIKQPFVLRPTPAPLPLRFLVGASRAIGKMPTKFFKSQLRIDCNERIVEIPFVLQNLLSTAGMTILDFGCAESVLPIYLATQGAQVVGVDLREYDFEHPNFRFCKGDFLNNDFSDAYFDAVVAVSSVEHVGLNVYSSRAYESGDNKVVREFRRVLKSGGVLILTVPFGKRYVDEELRVYDSQLLTELTDGFVNTKRKFYRRAVEGTHWLESSEEECSESGVHPVTGVAGVACLVCKKGDQSGKIDRPLQSG